MTLLFPLLLAMAALACYPAYLVSRRRGAESKWLPAAGLPALVLWAGLTGSGYGAQSLSNIVEVFMILAGAVMLCYLKVFVADRLLRRPLVSTYTIMALLALAAVLLRTFMPVLPE